MSGLAINREKCIGCESCVGTCPQGAIYIEDGKASVDKDTCVLCGMCVSSCPAEAISIEKEAGEAKFSDYRDVWVFAQCENGGIAPVAKELIGKSTLLSKKLGCKTVAILLCGKIKADSAASLCYAGADKVILISDDRLAFPSEETYTDIITDLIRERKPEILLFGATEFGRSLAPRIAARVRTGLTADCTILEIVEEKRLLQQTRPAFGGNLMATIVCPNSRPQMATVRPGVLPIPEEDSERPVSVEEYKPDIKPSLKEIVSVIEASETAASIADAKIIVSAGRGIGSKKNMELVSELAELLGGEYGVTRPLVDLGWSEYRHQIGQTGCSVSPKILITCGISGAIQHLAGISGAETVIAINTDKDAPIFSRADYAVVGDCVEVLKEIIREVKEQREKTKTHEVDCK